MPKPFFPKAPEMCLLLHSFCEICMRISVLLLEQEMVKEESFSTMLQTRVAKNPNQQTSSKPQSLEGGEGELRGCLATSQLSAAHATRNSEYLFHSTYLGAEQGAIPNSSPVSSGQPAHVPGVAMRLSSHLHKRPRLKATILIQNNSKCKISFFPLAPEGTSLNIGLLMNYCPVLQPGAAVHG